MLGEKRNTVRLVPLGALRCPDKTGQYRATSGTRRGPKADMREFVDQCLSGECRCGAPGVTSLSASMTVRGKIASAVVALRMVLELKRVPCLPQ